MLKHLFPLILGFKLQISTSPKQAARLIQKEVKTKDVLQNIGKNYGYLSAQKGKSMGISWGFSHCLELLQGF